MLLACRLFGRISNGKFTFSGKAGKIELETVFTDSLLAGSDETAETSMERFGLRTGLPESNVIAISAGSTDSEWRTFAAQLRNEIKLL